MVTTATHVEGGGQWSRPRHRPARTCVMFCGGGGRDEHDSGASRRARGAVFSLGFASS
jgi:hypothetical protein